MLTSHAESRVVAYVPTWIDLPTFAKTIDYPKVTHLNLAFENPVDDSGKLSVHRGAQALLTAARAQNVKVLVSIGGGSASSDSVLLTRYTKLLRQDARGKFVRTLAEYVDKQGFDGLDVDLEGPAIGPDYGAFIAELAPLLQAKGKLLTAALSRGYGGADVPDAALVQFDFVNIMAYDAVGPWNPRKAGQHSSMEFAQDNVAYWLRRGLPKAKAVLGVPFYGYGFGEAFRSDGYAYREILTRFRSPADSDQVGDTIWFNGRKTIREKTRFAKETGLGGVMIWSLDQDAPGADSLLSAIDEAFRAP